MPLKDAIYLSPESGVLFYTLGKIYVVRVCTVTVLHYCNQLLLFYSYAPDTYIIYACTCSTSLNALVCSTPHVFVSHL